MLLARCKALLNRMENFLWSRKKYKFIIKDWLTLPDLKSCAEVLKTMRFTQNIKPVVLNCPTAKKILLIAPHPDDEILGAGGALIKAIAAGASVKVVYLTSGKSMDAAIIEQETQRVAEKIGYSIEFFRYELNNIPVASDKIRKLANVILDYSPNIIFIPALFDDHDDHRRASQLLLECYRQFGLAKKTMVWCYQVYSTLIPNVVVDITDEISLKLAALRLWSTQNRSRNWAHYIKGKNACNVRFLHTAQERYAETFFVLPITEYMDLCATYYDRAPDSVYSYSQYLVSS